MLSFPLSMTRATESSLFFSRPFPRAHATRWTPPSGLGCFFFLFFWVFFVVGCWFFFFCLGWFFFFLCVFFFFGGVSFFFFFGFFCLLGVVFLFFLFFFGGFSAGEEENSLSSCPRSDVWAPELVPIRLFLFPLIFRRRDFPLFGSASRETSFFFSPRG